MFDFLYLEEWWMETIIAAIIGAVVTLVGIFVSYRLTLKEKFEKSIENQNGEIRNGYYGLSREHDGLSKEHENIINSNKEVNMEVRKTQDIIITLKESFAEEKAKEQMRYENLSKSQMDMVNVADKINAMAQELKGQAAEIVRLNELLKERDAKNISLENDIIQLKKKNKSLESENSRLEKENIELSKPNKKQEVTLGR